MKSGIKNLISDLKNKILQNKAELLQWAFFLAICIVHSFIFSHYMNFNPTNGTFQNYNPVRRLLDGQIPYKDFNDYLGLGHLYSGAIVTWLFGGNYASSLRAFGFLSTLCLGLIFISFGKAVFDKKRLVLPVTNFFLVLAIIQPAIFTNFISISQDILESITYATTVGNSARFIRGLILPISVLLVLAVVSAIKKYSDNKLLTNNIYIVNISAISGFSFIWSNDYGISCWLCLAIMTFWIFFCKSRKIFKAMVAMLAEIFLSFIFAFLFLEIFTLGHAISWIKDTFGTGNFQAWYYNSPKSYYLYNVDFSFIMLLQAAICIAYLIQIFIHSNDEKKVIRYAVPAYMNMTCFCAVNEYRILSGGDAAEVALVVIFITVVAEIINKIKLESFFKYVTITSLIVSTAYCGSTLKNELLFYYDQKKNINNYMSFDELGGVMTYLGEDLIAARDFLNGRTVWATYASGLETVTNTFQPSGTDYIIHVLGDKAREEYLKKYINKPADFTATIRDDYIVYEYWVRNANWFFYRQLYSDSHPVYYNTYELFWQKNEKGENHIVSDEIELSIEKIDDSTQKIIIRTDENISGYADVFIDYKVSKKEGCDPFLIQKYCFVQNSGTVFAQYPGWENFYLRAESAEFIPISVINGYGEVTISSVPQQDTCLELFGASCDRIFTAPYDYLEFSPQPGPDENTTILKISKTTKNQVIIQSSCGVTIDDKQYYYLDMSEDDNAYYITTAIDPELRENIISQYRFVVPTVKKSDSIYQASSLSDENWERGCNRIANILLFTYNDGLLQKIQNSKRMVCDKEYEIASYDYDELWIRVYLTEYPEKCKYPAYIKFE